MAPGERGVAFILESVEGLVDLCELVAQALDRVFTGSTTGWIDAKEHTDDQRSTDG